MLWVVLTFLVLVAVSVVIVALVALPNLRSGSQVLTPSGERLVREARSRLTNSSSHREPAARSGLVPPDRRESSP